MDLSMKQPGMFALGHTLVHLSVVITHFTFMDQTHKLKELMLSSVGLNLPVL